MKNNRTVNIITMIVLVAIVLTFLCILFTSCDKDINNQDGNPETYDRFYALPMYAGENNNVSTAPFKIYIDKETRVQYVYNTNSGGMCVLLDENGKPLLYDGKFKSEKE